MACFQLKGFTRYIRIIVPPSIMAIIPMIIMITTSSFHRLSQLSIPTYLTLLLLSLLHNARLPPYLFLLWRRGAQIPNLEEHGIVLYLMSQSQIKLTNKPKERRRKKNSSSSNSLHRWNFSCDTYQTVASLLFRVSSLSFFPWAGNTYLWSLPI